MTHCKNIVTSKGMDYSAGTGYEIAGTGLRVRIRVSLGLVRVSKGMLGLGLGLVLGLELGTTCFRNPAFPQNNPSRYHLTLPLITLSCKFLPIMDDFIQV